ncbi:type IV pilus modification protein PilV [Rhodoferax antarcticus]|uniref:type IV pilus modification protein PilV n=1 Tax=Rhodoferax antarcticus TaxID=81479 RepID=UPI00130196EE
MIEALISILIMSIGLLGIAGMQLKAISYQKNAWSTHRVAEITNDIAERILANPTGAKNGNYAYTADYATGKAATPSSNNCRTSSASCTTAQIAADDIADLLNKAQTILPGGAAQITGTPATGMVVTTMFMDKEFVDPASGALLPSTTCTSTIDASTSDIAWRNCCPAAASVPDGVRCRRFNLVPIEP